MVKTLKLVICGSRGCGKTSILEQLIYSSLSNTIDNNDNHTMEDTYVAHIESDRGVKEKVRFYEIGGSSDPKSAGLAKHFVTAADAFIFVLDASDANSLIYLQSLKSEMDRQKERREAQSIFLIINKTDLEAKISDKQISNFVSKEKITKSFEVSALKRRELVDAFVAITSKITTPVTKTFPFGKRDGR